MADEPPLPADEAAKRATLVAQLAAAGGAPDVLARGLVAAGALYSAGFWTLPQNTSYLARTNNSKMELWRSGAVYRDVWGAPTPAELRAAIADYDAAYAAAITQGTMPDVAEADALPGAPPAAPPSQGRQVVGVILVVALAAVLLAPKKRGGR